MSASMSDAVFARTPAKAGMYESFYLRAVSPTQPLGVWIRYTVHKRRDERPKGSIWCTVFDTGGPAPFMSKLTSDDLRAPADGWIAIADSKFGAGFADGACGPARWSLRFRCEEPELRHLPRPWMYRGPLPRTKLTTPAPAASFSGTLVIEDPGQGLRTIELRDWHGMVGHNWGTQHAERWIWLHGIDFEEDRAAWLDLAIGRIKLAGMTTPWVANGAICLGGRRHRLGGLGARGLRVRETPRSCSLVIPGEHGLSVTADVQTAEGALAGWSYADPDGGSHDVVNCSIAQLALDVAGLDGPPRRLHTAYGGAYEVGMRERDHGIAIAPFPDG
jgi:hypothetical protein